MEIPAYQPFYLETLDALRVELDRIGLEIPVSENMAPLGEPLCIGAKRIPNRFCAQPITGCDADASGAPGKLTRRRYLRYAQGGFGLIWVEATRVGIPDAAAHLALNAQTVEAFRSLADAIRQAAPADPLLILQLAAAPNLFGNGLPDAEIEHSRAQLVEAAGLAAGAGFDGVDLCCLRNTLPGSLLRASGRPGPYGGSLENRARFLLEALAEIREHHPSLLLAVRLCAFDAVAGEFGVSATDYRQPDPAEPARLARLLAAAGVRMLNVTAASPNLRGAPAERSRQARGEAEEPDEHPLMTLQRQLHLAAVLRQAAPGMAIVGSGLSWLRQFAPHVAAGSLEGGWMDLAGFGRGALACPDMPLAVLEKGHIEPGATCVRCHACSCLKAQHEPVGCVLQDHTVYGPVYRHMRRFDSDQLLAGASRCHLCEAAPCIAASPIRTDIPGFIRAFRDGNEDHAFALIRRRDPLPELTSQLSPAWLQGEGACVETTLTGKPVPILDLQFAIAWRARDRGASGVRLPERASGKHVAIIGGGPAGIAAAVHLLEQGHAVTIFEHSDRLGGTPERVIPSVRLPDIQAEIAALLRPALDSGRVCVKFGATLGRNIDLAALQASHEAVLLALGLWREHSIGSAKGVMGGLEFLEAAKRNTLGAVPARAALLAGGDSAMDAGRTLQHLGAKEIFIVFGGPRAAMHWHMPESWFATPGIHAMMQWKPLRYECRPDGTLSALRLLHTELGVEAALAVDLAIEAMQLELADAEALAPILEPAAPRHCRTALERVYAAGGILNGGASVAQCVAEGIAAAETIHSDLTSVTL